MRAISIAIYGLMHIVCRNKMLTLAKQIEDPFKLIFVHFEIIFNNIYIIHTIYVL